MKKFEEILINIGENSEELNTLEKKITNLRDVKSLIYRKYDRKVHGTYKDYIGEHKIELDELDKEETELSEKILDARLTGKILTNNAKIALFNDKMLLVLDILKKYENKPHGEKTSKKIRDEIMDKVGVWFFIYNDHYTIQYGKYRTYEIECGTKYINGNRQPLLPNNKIYVPTMEELEIYYINKTYVENIEYCVNELKRLHLEIVHMRDEFNKLITSYNELTVDGIKHVNLRECIYSTIQFGN